MTRPDPTTIAPVTPDLSLLDRVQLDRYLGDDAVLHAMHSAAAEGDDAFASHRWLLDSAPKRMAFWSVYGDLLAEGPPRRVLDVGGGYTAITRNLRAAHEYTLLDIMVHDPHDRLRTIETELGAFWCAEEWFGHEPDASLDLVIANDLFPNVDQRLATFLDRYLPRCRELRLILTCYNTPRWYRVQRTDGDEVFHMMAWDGEAVRRVLEPHRARLDDADLDVLLENPPSMFANGRQLYRAVLRGDLQP